MNTHPEFIEQTDQNARPARKEWAEPQIMTERSLEASAQNQPPIPTPPGEFGYRSGESGYRLGPLGASGLGGGCIF